VTATGSWEKAVDLVTTRSYGLAIADLELRSRDGCRLVSTLRRVSPETPIVATTAYPAEEVVAFAKDHVEAFLVKPFRIDELLKVVRAAVDGGVPSHLSGMSRFTPRHQGAPLLAASG
jgi:CheY-like chemotaxis protein